MKNLYRLKLGFTLVTACLFVDSTIASDKLESGPSPQLAGIAPNLLKNEARRKEIKNSLATIRSGYQELTLEKFDSLYEKRPLFGKFLDNDEYHSAALDFYESISTTVYKAESFCWVEKSNWKKTGTGVGQFECRLSSISIDFKLEELSLDNNVSTRKEIILWLPDNGGYEDIKYDGYFRFPEMTTSEGQKILLGENIRPTIYYQLMPLRAERNGFSGGVIGFSDSMRLNYALLKQSMYLEGRVLGIEYDDQFIYLASKKSTFPIKHKTETIERLETE